MIKKICIFGAGGFAKEVYWLAIQCGYQIDYFIDLYSGENYNGIEIKDENYFNPSQHKAVIAIGNSSLRQKIIQRATSKYGEDIFETLISHQANLMSNNITVGKGSIICANCILTCDIKLGNFSQLNLATTIGHEVITDDYFTTAPGVHINGKVKIGKCVYFGSNSSTVENISICDNVIVGAAACVSKDILDSGIYVGIPAKKMEKKNG